MLEHGGELATTLVGIGGFLLLAAVVRHYTRTSPLPPETWLLLAGIAYALARNHWLPALPVLMMEPQTVFLLLLPAMVFAGGAALPGRVLARQWLPLGVMAIGGTLLATVVIGVAVAWMLGFALVHGLWFGVALAATDPAAVSVVIHRFSIPQRLELLMEGESIFNDSVAIVLFTALGAVVLAGETFDARGTLALFAWNLAGGIVCGLALGWFAGKLVVVWKEQNRFTGITLTVLLCYGSFLLAEHVLSLSGVIAVLCAALVFSHVRLAGGTRQHDDLFHGFWRYISVLAGSVLFFLLGVETGSHPFPLVWAIGGIVVTLLLARAATVYGGGLVLGALRHPVPMSWQHVQLLGGAKGAIPVALLLMVPDDYPHKLSMLCLVFVAVAFTLVVNPLLLKKYLDARALEQDAETVS